MGRSLAVSAVAFAAISSFGLTFGGEANAAEPTPSDRALAVTLLQQGKELMAANNLAEACPKLEESYRVDADLGTLLNLALCHDQAGKMALAWTELTAAAAEATRNRQPDRATLAERRAAALEPRIGRVNVRIGGAPPAAGTEVRLDGALLTQGAAAQTIAVDPGAHSVQVTATGKKPRATTFRADEGKTASVDLRPLEDDGAAVVPSASAPESVVPATAPASSASPLYVLGIVVASIGAVGLGAGTYFGMTAYSRRNDRSELCDTSNVCASPEGVRADNDSRDNARLSTITFLGGAAFVAAGITLVVTQAHPRASASARRSVVHTTVALHPELAPGFGRLVLGGTF